MSETICAPVPSPVTQVFGNVPDWDPKYYAKWGYPGHNGIDYGCPSGTPVCPGLSGPLSKVAFEADGFGQYAIQDCGAFWLYYCHLTEGGIYAKVGDMLQQGRAFCNSGYTGAVYPKGSNGAHLHFGGRLKNYPVNDEWKGWRDPFKIQLLVKPAPGPTSATIFQPPNLASLPNSIAYKPSGLITKFIKVRAKPDNGAQIDQINPGEKFMVFGWRAFTGNDYWFLGMTQRGIVGWAAAFYQGETWLEVA